MESKNKTICILILSVLSGGLFGLFGTGCSKTPKNESRSPVARKRGEALQKDIPDDLETRLGEILPRTVETFSVSSPLRYFGPDNLFDLIDGGAEIYVEYGLAKMVTSDFKSESHPDLTITVEVYDQGSLVGAFGRMTRFLLEKVDPSNADQGLPESLKGRGLFGATDLIFFKDHYLVHITLIDESVNASLESMSKAGQAILPPFAEALASKIEADPPLPKELTLFPTEHLIARSEAWAPKNLVGVQGLGSGFSFRYRDGGADWTLFATDEIKEQSSLEAKIEQLRENAADKKLFAFEPAGKRIVGFAANAEKWTEKNRKTAMEQVGSLKKATLKAP
jgi:hypothetical protein